MHAHDVLILDPFQHFPSLKLMLDEKGFKTLYSTATTPEGIESFQFYGNEKVFKKKYGFQPQNFIINQIQTFNIIILVLPIDVNDTRINYINLIDKCRLFIYQHSHSNTTKILIDNSDYPSDPLSDNKIKSFGFHRVYKREMHRNRIYHNLIKPFPFVIFGLLDPIYEFFFMNKKSIDFEKKTKKIFWAGPLYNHSNPHINYFVSRHDAMHLITSSRNYSRFQIEKDFLAKKKYDKLMNSYSFFLNLNGVGNICKRFFEGLQFQGIPILENFEVRFPKEFRNLEELLRNNSFNTLDTLDKLVDNLFSKSSSELIDTSRFIQNEMNKSKIVDVLELR